MWREVINISKIFLAFYLFLSLSAYIQFLFGVNLISALFAIALPLLYISISLKFNSTSISFLRFFYKPYIFIISFFGFISFYPPKWDDEFAYPAQLPKLFTQLGDNKLNEFQFFWSSLYDSSISASTNFYFLFDNFFALRFFNLIAISLLLLIFFDLSFKKKNRNFIILIFILLFITLPVIASHGVILKNDILAALLIPASYYFLYGNKLLTQKVYHIGFIQFSFNKCLGFFSLALLTTIKPVFFITCIPLIIFYFYDNRRYFVSNFFIFSGLILFVSLPWIIRSYISTGQPFFPFIYIPALGFNFLNYGVDDYLVFKTMMYEHHTSLTNFNIFNGSLTGFLSHFYNRFGYTFFILFFLLFFLKDKKFSILFILIVVNLFLFCFWEGRYWIGLGLLLLVIILDHFKNLFFIPLLIGIFFNCNEAIKIYKNMHMKPALSYFKGEEYFLDKHLNMMENNKLIKYLNTYALNTNILIDNGIYFHIDPSVKIYAWNQLNIGPFNNVDYEKFKSNLIEREISYIVYAFDAYKGYIDFGFNSETTTNIKDFFNTNINYIIKLENEGLLKYETTFGRSSIYKVNIDDN